ncbi:lysosomal acid glucosylceramidase-like [Neodiprion pinetum]|uniref:lysosomal acid glucosylceramidase-like n=1 Tax=Neodiprion pinetum TaxID=441929 RepID=UPI001EDFC23D|nr:lysosomal acid glucosylceramidase-like [Neodiprion pinetum]
MKTNDYYLCQDGFLLEEYYQVYADYIIKFMDEYKEHGLEMWAISTGNEPVNGILPESIYNCMAWTPQGIANWVAENLGPTISRSNHSETLIFTLDDQRSRLSWFVEEMFENELAKNYTAGIAVHWYFDQMSSTNLLDETHSNYSDKFLLLTEAAIWNATADTYVSLGCWDRAEQYILDIIENLEHWVTGWVDWNLALDIDSGPAWDNNTLDASIVVNADEDEFYKQPMFYAIAHFSKFIPRESVRVELSMSQDETSVKSVAFKTPENETVLVIYNMSTEEQQVTVYDPERGNFTLQLPFKSIQTILYK